MSQKTVVTFGTFDLFHYGHLKILERAAAYGDRLIVGISSDQFNFEKKKKYPVFSEGHRMEIVSAIRYVEGVFLEESFEKKREYLVEHQADVFVMGDDWRGKFDEFKDICEVVYLERTPELSTTEYKSIIRNLLDS
ncbi:glycerol-3-phosphate cytidyltransferase [gamma proteobacterium HTCC5015]|nr:glycerol-3-phosphate cytidyltransferase [gamma proteobacterium HTCC5015]